MLYLQSIFAHFPYALICGDIKMLQKYRLSEIYNGDQNIVSKLLGLQNRKNHVYWIGEIRRMSRTLNT